MEDNLGIEKLFFELASESRLSILRELKKENLKMQEIARRLDVTATEAFRQLERLSAASLVKKQPDGTFTLAEYGKLVLQLSSSLEFAFKNKEYFAAHDLSHIPAQFVNRLGELSQAQLGLDTVENLNRTERAFTEAEAYSWGIAEGTVPEHMAPIMEERMRKGIKMRFLIPENRFQPITDPVSVRNVEARGLADLPAIVVLTEKLAGICFRQVGGRIDYAGFFGEDPAFHNWVKDLFLYYWEKGKRA
jgi:predicted transcriptional regulator